jgi:hypothetical protein
MCLCFSIVWITLLDVVKLQWYQRLDSILGDAEIPIFDHGRAASRTGAHHRSGTVFSR